MPDLMADYRQAREWAVAILARDPDTWVILDTETTGLAHDAEVVEIGILAPDGAVLLDRRIRPHLPIPSEAIAIHGIADADVLACPTFDALAGAIVDLLAGKLVVVYNAAFDRRILEQSAAFAGCVDRWGYLDAVGTFWHCLMEWWSQWCGDWSDYRGNYRWQRLPRDAGAHSAIGDCRSSLALLKRMAAPEDGGATSPVPPPPPRIGLP